RNAAATEIVAGLGAEPIRGDLADAGVLRAAAEAADGVIHLAAPRGEHLPEQDRAASDAMQTGAAGKPYVHTGGSWVYGDTDGVVEEDAPFAPPELVAWRLANEKHVLDNAKAGGHPVLVMPGVVYGQREGGLIRAFYLDPARAAGAVPCIGDGANHCAVVHAEDVAELYVLALGAAPGSVYFGVNGEAPTQRAVAEAISKVAGHPGRIRSIGLDQAHAEMGPIADAFVLDQQISNRRAVTELGWKPQHTDVLAELAAS
ncbi:MAG TPA: NAD-dependent epimerase/dehydratase family protein, partial [Pseudonocardiaceae bacterium]|nr:NAD-dependent epimerase/dehydratase family protein [Pseudonocardiaceae bacterium]